MSTILAFVTIEGDHIIKFPYRTTTDITKAVLRASTKEEQLMIIKEDLWKCVYNQDSLVELSWWNDTCKEVEHMLDNKTLCLVEI